MLDGQRREADEVAEAELNQLDEVWVDARAVYRVLGLLFEPVQVGLEEAGEEERQNRAEVVEHLQLGVLLFFDDLALVDKAKVVGENLAELDHKLLEDERDLELLV